MERIDRYIESIFKHIEGDAEEIKNSKEEMKTHIQQMAEEMMAEGKSEEDSIKIALDRFGEKNKIEKELSQEFKRSRNIRKPIAIVGTAVFVLLGMIFGYKYYRASQWDEGLIIPNGITIRDKMDAPLIEGTIMFQGQILVYDEGVINKIVAYVKDGKSKMICSEKEADNLDMDKIMYSIGTQWNGPVIPNGGLGTINILKDGTFVASKQIEPNKSQHIKGKLSKEALDYITEIYKNPPEIK